MPDASPILLTGVGLACGLGLSATAAWEAVKAGRRGIGLMPAMESPLPPVSDGGQALDLPADFEPSMSREARYLRFTVLNAIDDAGGLARLPAPDRVSVMLGTTLHGMRAGGRFLRTGNTDELRAFLAGDVVADALHGLPIAGGRATTCSACSSSLGSVALGVTLLQSGAADVVIAGGYDPISEYAWAGFNALRLVSGPPLRPFAVGRCGMKLAESYAVLILERAEDAEPRGARPLAVVAGWGESADAHHLTQPHPQGAGALAAMNQAIDRAGIESGDVDLVAAHATGTPDNDAAEAAALARLFGERLPDVPVVAFKAHLGHTLGGAGATELILAALALREQTIPPTPLDAAETVEFPGLRLTRGPAMSSRLRHALVTSLGFGGANTSVVLSAYDHGASVPKPLPHRLARDVVITGVGVVLPGVTDRAGVRRLLAGDAPALGRSPDATVVEGLINARRVRRMSDYVKLTLAATTLACRDAALSSESLRDAGAILGTMHGSAGFSRTYYDQIVREGPLAANPLLFAEGVPNAGAAQLSLMLGLTGACQTIVGTRTAGLDALRLALLRVAEGTVDRVLVGAAEEDDATTNAAYDACGLRGPDGFLNRAGAVTLVLESADAAAARGAKVLARLTHASAASGPRDRLAETLTRAMRPLPPAGRVLASHSGTWLDTAGRIAHRQAERPEPLVSHDGLFGELFSVTPLLAVATAAWDVTPVTAVVPCADWSGLATVVRLEPG